MDRRFITTAFELPGCRIARNLGVVRGIVVRSRSVVGTFGAGIQTIFGGNITLWSRLCEQTRTEAFDILVRHADEIGANAIIGMRYDATEISKGVTEVLAYGTAVVAVAANTAPPPAAAQAERPMAAAAPVVIPGAGVDPGAGAGVNPGAPGAASNVRIPGAFNW